jgi:hypothetical protein
MGKNAAQTAKFSSTDKRVVEIKFNQPTASSDGGSLLLKEADRTMGLTEIIAKCIRDDRQSSKIEHTVQELVQQRVFGIGCGYADCNDADHLAEDPMQKLLLERDPITGLRLGSQPTLSRLENSVGASELMAMSLEMVQRILEKHGERLGGKVEKITIDIDGTEDKAHGEQEGTCYNGYYGSNCYQPLLGMVTFNEEVQQYVVAAVLRPGTAGAQGASYMIKKLVEHIYKQFPEAQIVVRLDGGFAQPDIFDWLDTWGEVVGLQYLVGMAGNSRLESESSEAMKVVWEKASQSHQTESMYGEMSYQAKSWSHPRRVIYKAEVVWASGKLPRANDRYVVTNMSLSAEKTYDFYRLRGDSENRIKELKLGMELDRTSCSSFLANQFRLLLTLASFGLFQWIRSYAVGTEASQWQVQTLRERLIKIGTRVKSSLRRLEVLLPQSYPWRELWYCLLGRLQALTV